MHYYAGNHDDDTPSFLSISAALEDYVDTVAAAVLRYVKAKTRSKHDVLPLLGRVECLVQSSRNRQTGVAIGAEAPRLCSKRYTTWKTRLVVAQWLNVFLRKADVRENRLHRANCQCHRADLNFDAMTCSNRQSFIPCSCSARWRAGIHSTCSVESPRYATKQVWRYAASGCFLVLRMTRRPKANTIFIVNRSPDGAALPLEIRWQDVKPKRISSAQQLSGNDPKAFNSWEHPNRLTTRAIYAPKIIDGAAQMSLPPLSFTCARAWVAPTVFALRRATHRVAPTFLLRRATLGSPLHFCAPAGDPRIFCPADVSDRDAPAHFIRLEGGEHDFGDVTRCP